MPRRQADRACAAEGDAVAYVERSRRRGDNNWCHAPGPRGYGCCRERGHHGRVHVSLTYGLELLDKWTGHGHTRQSLLTESEVE